MTQGRRFMPAAAGTLAALVFHGLALLWLLNVSFPMPMPQKGATVVVDRHGHPLRAFADAEGVWRFPARPDQVSPLYLEALLTYEDQWFYRHPGVNPLALVRAAFQNAVSGRVVSGGSTLTMQVARILTGPSPDRFSVQGKLVQVLRALQLEFYLTKTQILSIYLSHAPFGANIEGVGAAAYTWLGKDARDLTHAEAALLAVLPQAPSRFRPDRHPGAAVRARDKVLNRMAAFGIWPAETVAMARQEPVVPFRFPEPMTAPLAARRLKSGDPAAQEIQTFLDMDLQRHVADVLRQYVAGLSPSQSGAVMVARARSMEVLVYAGSADFTADLRHGHVDMIRALRSPGSALKPFIYGLAMDEGLIHSHSMLLDVPRIGQAYDPGNFTGGFQGPVTVVRALQDSLNLPAIQVLELLGPGKFNDRLSHAGARFRFRGSPNLSMALGGVGTDLESLITLYGALARGGLAARPRLAKAEPLSERYLMSPGAAYIIRQMLSRPFPGREEISRLSGDWPVAWKTGTSYGFRDAWAFAIKGDFLAGVWVGRPDGSPSPGQYGAVTAVPLLAMVLEGLDRHAGPDQVPETVTRETICWPSGLTPERLVRNGQLPLGACVQKHQAYVLNHQLPPTLTGTSGMAAPLIQSFWVDDQGRRATPLCGGRRMTAFACWPWQAEPFIPKEWQRERLIPPPSPLCPDLASVTVPGIRITSISDQSILRRQPGERKDIRVPLSAVGGQGKLYWFLNRKALNDGRMLTAMPMPGAGAFQLAVVDENGNADQIHFTVAGPEPDNDAPAVSQPAGRKQNKTEASGFSGTAVK